jgi:CheY-like chemotaxis protein
MTDEQQNKIFKAFVQADDSMTRRFGGTGQGLALSKKLAQELGGDVTLVQSVPNKGSTFLFKIKDRPDHLESDIEAVNLIDKTEIDFNEKLLSKTKVLVVEDSPENQRLICIYLKKYGARVEIAENGHIGYSKAIKGNFDIVLMDIQMPELDGYSATQKLRAAGFAKPIIALTAHAMSDVRKKCLNVGCSDYVAKPIDHEELISSIVKHTS